MPNSVGTAYLTLVPKLDKNFASTAEKELGSTGKSGGSKFSDGFSGKFTSAVKNLAGAAVVIKAGQTLGEQFMASFNQFSSFEQLEGGAKLMFGGAYDYVEQRAKEAFANVQLSQNDYLQQVNGFATGLKTSLGGDEMAAAQLADKIVTAEADIVSATGNTRENIENAFNGIMKSNYTMLDNLQIGIKPTKEGMQEVIDKVNEWNAANGNATKYSIDNIADQQAALIDYIDMVGMSGYASAEAAGTIEGSMASAKAAWDNLLLAIANPDGDWTGAFQSLIGAVGNFIKQAWPIVTGIVGRIPELLSMIGQTILQNSPQLGQKISELVQQLGGWLVANMPTILLAATQMFGGLLAALVMAGADLLSGIGGAIGDACEYVAGAAGEMLTAGIQFMDGLSQGISAGIDGVISTVTGAIGGVIDTVTSMLGIHSPSRVMAQMGGYTMQGFADGLNKNAGAAESAMRNAMSGVIDNASVSASVDATVAARSAQNGAISGLSDSFGGMGVYIDGRKLVGTISSEMDRSLGGFVR